MGYANGDAGRSLWWTLISTSSTKVVVLVPVLAPLIVVELVLNDNKSTSTGTKFRNSCSVGTATCLIYDIWENILVLTLR
eukprot:SAG11_NODE_3220_length_2602_cov_2.565721_1_plen_80_part_00